MHRRHLGSILGCLIAFAVLVGNERVLSQSRLTLEWVFGPEGRAVARVPSFVWLDDGSAILYDTRRPAAERTFEKLDPATGSRSST